MIEMDPTITAFETICDRMSTVEENADIVRGHLMWEHMCKPYGRLNPVLLNLPSSLKLRLKDEFVSNVSEMRPNLKGRPFLKCSYISVDCKGGCNVEDFKSHYRPLYHQLFPEKAAQIIKFHEENGNSPRCADLDIPSVEEFVHDEVDRRVMRDAVDPAIFSRDIYLDDFDDVWLCAERSATLDQHITQAWRIFLAAGHTSSCMELHISPWTGYAAKYWRAMIHFRDVKQNPAAHREFFEKHEIPQRVPSWVLDYCGKHSVFSSFMPELKEMLSIVRTL